VDVVAPLPVSYREDAAFGLGASRGRPVPTRRRA
jgi:hypothetical protein